jgi:hypothetical protein
MQVFMRVIPVISMTQKYYPLDKILLLFATPFLRKAELKYYNFVENQVKKRLSLHAPRPDL